MNAEQTPRKRRGLQGIDKVMLIVIGALGLVMIALLIAPRLGLAPINAQIMLILPLVMVFVLLARGAYALFRRLKSRGARMIVGTLLAFVLMLLFMLAVSYVSLIGGFSLPSRYATIASPSGARKLVVLRMLDPDEARIEARRAARLEADPEADPETAIEDWGYVYAAYPQVLRFFYRCDADVEGEVHIAYDGGSALMVEWQEDESTARFFVEEPGPGDGGECLVKY